MTMPNFMKLYAVALISFLVIDLVWLGVVARSFYQTQMGHLDARQRQLDRSDRVSASSSFWASSCLVVGRPWSARA